MATTSHRGGRDHRARTTRTTPATMSSRSKRLFGFGRAHSSVPRRAASLLEYAGVVVDGSEQGGVRRDGEQGGQPHGDGLGRAATKPGEEQVCAGDGDAEQHRAVQVAPHGDDQDDPPDSARGTVVVGAKQQEDEREEGQREELHLHRGERRQGTERDEGQGDGRGTVAGPGSPGADGEQDQRDDVQDELRRDDAHRTDDRQCREDQLTEDRHVGPPGARRRGERDPVRDRAGSTRSRGRGRPPSRCPPRWTRSGHRRGPRRPQRGRTSARAEPPAWPRRPHRPPCRESY